MSCLCRGARVGSDDITVLNGILR